MFGYIGIIIELADKGEKRQSDFGCLRGGVTVGSQSKWRSPGGYLLGSLPFCRPFATIGSHLGSRQNEPKLDLLG